MSSHKIRNNYFTRIEGSIYAAITVDGENLDFDTCYFEEPISRQAVQLIDSA
ncbi:MAG: hypothetical protein M3220_22635 [Chloroflexota bacterium]|nr:hypothetical protein [Chloroflexota bacterium]